MNIQEKIHAKAYRFATAYGLGQNKFYARLISAVSIPCAFLVNSLLHDHYRSIIALTLIIIFIGFIIHSIAAFGIEKEEYPHLVIHYPLGVFLMFWGISFKIKVVIFGFIIFHMISFIHTFLDNPFTKNIPYVHERTKFFLTSIMCGIGMNILLRLLMWIVI